MAKRYQQASKKYKNEEKLRGNREYKNIFARYEILQNNLKEIFCKLWLYIAFKYIVGTTYGILSYSYF